MASFTFARKIQSAQDLVNALGLTGLTGAPSINSQEDPATLRKQVIVALPGATLTPAQLVKLRAIAMWMGWGEDTTL